MFTRQTSKCSDGRTDIGCFGIIDPVNIVYPRNKLRAMRQAFKCFKAASMLPIEKPMA